MATQGKYNPFSKNFFLSTPSITFAKPENETFPNVKNDVHNPRQYAIPLQLERVRVDLSRWRQAVSEAENAYVPYRVMLQQMYVDKILEGHTKACLNKRNTLTLKKKIKVGKQNSSGIWEENAEVTKLFNNKKWFKQLMTEVLNAQYYGYSLIQLGDLVIKDKSYKFTNVMSLKRWLIRPDYHQYCQLPYSLLGFNFLDDSIKDDNGNSFSDWLIYVDTPSDTGASICGYGLLYNVALYAIMLRNNMAHNADFNQMFVAPYRHMKTDEEFDSEQWKLLEDSLEQMGTNGYVMTGKEDELNFITGNTGTGYQSYKDFEERCQKLISKILLGHANALDTQSTSMGGGAKGMNILQSDATPEGKAMIDIEQAQDEFILTFLNDTVYEKLIKHGFPLPADCEFYFADDNEKFEQRIKEDAANQATANIVVAMSQAGLKTTPEWFTERTGIPTEEKPEQPANSFGFNKPSFAEKMVKVRNLYKHEHKA